MSNLRIVGIVPSSGSAPETQPTCVVDLSGSISESETKSPSTAFDCLPLFDIVWSGRSRRESHDSGMGESEVDSTPKAWRRCGVSVL